MGEVCAIVLAAGKGKRMGAGINKQFLILKDKPLLYYSLMAFENCKNVDAIVLVTAKEEMDYCRTKIIDKYKFKKIIAVTEGGSERQKSVYNGLITAKGFKVVLIHDGARPFIDSDIIESGIDNAIKYGASACGVTPKDTIKIKDKSGFSIDTLDRNSLFIVQTPQCFDYDLIFNCHKKIIKENINVTDDTSIVEYFGHKVFLYNGSYNNLKITTPEDLIIGEKILDSLLNN
ncbi:2-C-methyl-D-erythritol 4-phosphate cytidylyltransferase [Candidatus Clostridium stratigraminis]|uniref:2-C-methyl-D-erythritol 4-phosphate cytidylyltransferase n=1 Tax=Candidatus Clostridium stratigraminis TaxID=3381661 RepID=A0ABW8T9V2_9CLOT